MIARLPKFVRSPKRCSSQEARTAQGERIYAIGDIHGRLDLLDEKLDLIDRDLAARPHPNAMLLLLGDYIDRGPSSSGVIERLLQMQQRYPTTCLKGNHEAILSGFLADPKVLIEWAGLGGIATLQSYGLAPVLRPDADGRRILAMQLWERMPDAHHAFLDSLPLLHVSGDYVFVHAGLRPRTPLTKQVEDDLLWIREDFTQYEPLHEKVVVHGHTPVLAPEVLSNRINIDTGAFATNRLTCLVLEDDQRRFI